ncbi:Clostripain family protein [compost metagenome]
MRARIALLLSLCALTVGCGVANPGGNTGTSSEESVFASSNLGGSAYRGFKVKPQFPPQRHAPAPEAVKLLYIMGDDQVISGGDNGIFANPGAKDILAAIDDQASDTVFNLAFHDEKGVGDTLLYSFRADRDPKRLSAATSLVAPGVTEVQSNNPRVFAEVMSWAFKAHPAPRRYLQVFAHGEGVYGMGNDDHQTDPKGAALPANLAYEDKTPLHEVGTAFHAATQDRPIDLVNFLSCLMGNVETMVELRGAVRYAIASELPIHVNQQSTIGLSALFDKLVGEKPHDPLAVAKDLAKAANATTKGPIGYTGYAAIAVVDLDKTHQLQLSLDRFAKALIAGLPQHGDRIRAAYDAVPLLTGPGSGTGDIPRYANMRDMWRFTTEIIQRVEEPSIRAAAVDVRKAYHAAVVQEADAGKNALQGLSIFLPPRQKASDMSTFLKGDFRKTRFGRETAWADMIAAIALN